MSHVVTDDRPLISHTGRAYFPIAFLARLPFAMMVVGVLTLVVATTGSVALGGLTSAAVGVGTVLAGPIVGDAVDRLGQRRVLAPLGLVNAALLAAFPFVVASGAAEWMLLLNGLCIGLTAPQAAAMSRSRLMGIIRDRLAPPRRVRAFSRTMSYESAVDETAFVVGPVLVGLLASFIAPWAPIAGAAAISFVFVTWFALHPTATTAGPARHAPLTIAPARELMSPPILVLVGATFAVGLFFGTALTSLTAFMAARGEVDAAPLLYGLMGIGSAVLALAVAALPPSFALGRRWVAFGAVLAIAATGYAFAQDVPWAVAMLCLMGLGIGPTLVTLFSLAGLRSPAGRSATTMTLLGSALVLAQSLASALTGALAESAGPGLVMAFPALAAGIVLALGAVNLPLERRRMPPTLERAERVSVGSAASPAGTPAAGR